MSSNKSRSEKNQIALAPQRNNGKLRVVALLKAGAAVIAQKGYQAATMAEIGEKAGAPPGSLYRFFPNKKILADALIQRFGELINEAFDKIDAQIKAMSMADLAEAFLKILVEAHEEKEAVTALLAASDWSGKLQEFRVIMRKRIVQTLILRCPGLDLKTSKAMAVVIAHSAKIPGAITAELSGMARAEAEAELHAMMANYLKLKLKTSTAT